MSRPKVIIKGILGLRAEPNQRVYNSLTLTVVSVGLSVELQQKAYNSLALLYMLWCVCRPQWGAASEGLYSLTLTGMSVGLCAMMRSWAHYS